MKRLSPRELRRLQSRMMGNLGLDIEEMGVAERVVIKLADKEIILKGPSVIAMKVEKERIYQIVGGEVVEEEVPPAYEPSQEDIILVAAQTGVGDEDAKKALIETGGDLAKAILLLKSRR